MQKMMVFIFLSFVSMPISRASLANDFFSIPAVIFQIETPDALEKLDMTLKYPEGLLKKFKPEGAVITKKTGNNNTISFYATKSYLTFSHTVYVNGTFESSENDILCEKNEKGYELNFNFEGSDSMITDNIDRINAKLCVKVLNSKLITGVVRSRIYKNENYSNLLGSVVKGIIEAQINPLLKALREDVHAQ